MKKQSLESCVKDVRTKNSITQQQLADVVGVSRQTIVAIEGGNYTPSVLLAIKIANHLGQSVEVLFTIKE